MGRGEERVPTSGPPWLLVIDGRHRELYELLRRCVEEESGLVEVILDRRQQERRRGSSGTGIERRRVERRRRSPAVGVVYSVVGKGVSSEAGAAGPVVDAAGAGRKVPLTVGEQACPRCGVVVEFDLPRFVVPPAHWEVAVVHTPNASHIAQHTVDIQAFAGSGRPLLACRSRPRPSPVVTPARLPS